MSFLTEEVNLKRNLAKTRKNKSLKISKVDHSRNRFLDICHYYKRNRYTLKLSHTD